MRAIVLFAAPLLLAGQDWSAEKEAVLGRAMAAEYRKQMTVVESDTASAYFSVLSERLRTTLLAGAPDVKISLVKNEPHGPLRAPSALPGGYIFVPARMIAEAADEAAFARLLAHAMAHVTERHVVPRRLGHTNVVTIPFVFAGGFDGPPNDRMLVPQAARAMQEEWELQANERAEEMMRSFAPDQRFAALQAELRALEPPRKPPTLRRASEPVRQ